MKLLIDPVYSIKRERGHVFHAAYSSRESGRQCVLKSTGGGTRSQGPQHNFEAEEMTPTYPLICEQCVLSEQHFGRLKPHNCTHPAHALINNADAPSQRPLPTLPLHPSSPAWCPGLLRSAHTPIPICFQGRNSIISPGSCSTIRE